MKNKTSKRHRVNEVERGKACPALSVNEFYDEWTSNVLTKIFASFFFKKEGEICYNTFVKSYPHLKFETEIWNTNALTCGIDEVGRGCFAGPLVAAGVILKPIQDIATQKYILSFGINDSKLLSKQKRELIKKVTQEYILFSTVQYVSIEDINLDGIGNANKKAFLKVAQEVLKNHPDVIFLTDAFKIPEINTSIQKNIIRGDKTSISIALASIVAKVSRDNFMENLSTEFPVYGFEKHKGYGTKLHREFLKTHGPCKHHRTEFIKNYM